jgi:uncharacterized repeat protein (TIGR03803 family)
MKFRLGSSFVVAATLVGAGYFLYAFSPTGQVEKQIRQFGAPIAAKLSASDRLQHVDQSYRPAAESAPEAPSGLKPVELEAWTALARRESALVPVFPENYSEGTEVSARGMTVMLKPRQGNAARAKIENGKLVYHDAYTDTDSLQVVSNGRSEEFLLLRDAQAPRRFDYDLSAAAGVADIALRDDAVHFRNASGEEMQIEAPWLIESGGRKVAHAVHWELTPASDGAVGSQLALVIDHPEQLHYPVVIDPSWTASLGSLNTARSGHTATLLTNGEVLVAGGYGTAALTSAELYNPATGTWTTTGSLNAARQYHTATLLTNGQVLVAGGEDNSGDALASAELYNPTSGTWTTTIGSMATARYLHTATLLSNGKVLVAGGYNALASAELYNPTTGMWTTTGSMTTGRNDHTATLLTNGQVLVAGGTGASGALSSAELYTTSSGTWSTTGSLTNARYLHTATELVNGQVLVAGGFGTGGPLATSELYTVASGTWATTTGSMSTARYAHSAVLLPNNLVLVTGGDGTSGYVSTGETFNISTGTWTSVGSSSVAADYQTSTVLANGQVLVVGGSNGSPLSASEIYFAPAGGFSTPGSMANARVYHTATLLPSGLVMVAGGDGTSGPLASSELFNPNTSAWSSTSGNLNVARFGQTATLLNNGQVLAVGGVGSNGLGITTAELYNPSNITWTTTGNLAYGRIGHTATLLPSGQVLVCGGAPDNISSNPTSTAELYNPSAGTWTQTGSMTTARYNHTATLLPNGEVLVAGGYELYSGTNGGGANADPLASAELYNPVTGTWTSTGSMANARVNATATLLPSGEVLVAGGYNGSYLTGAELYNPATGTWSSTGTLSAATADATATLLANGQVLLAGGATTSGNLATAELYNPATGVWTNTGSLPAARSSACATLLPNREVLIEGGYGTSGQLSSAALYNTAAGTSQTPTITTAATIYATQSVTVTGSRFTGISEASDGGTGNSSSNIPVVQLESMANEQVLSLSVNSSLAYSATTYTSQPQSGLVPGYVLLTMFVGGSPSISHIVPYAQLLPVISSATTASLTAGAPFSYQIVSSNSPSSYAAGSLPSGLSLNSATGLITGTVATPGSYPISLTATNTAGTSSAVTLTLTVNPATFTFASAGTVGLTTNGYNATGVTLNLSLGFAPPTGTSLTVINNTGLPFIQGQFSNVTQGQLVLLSYGGMNYAFVANYYGGTGNDLVLQWANNRAEAWGKNTYGQLGNNSTTSSDVPVSVLSSGVLSGKTIVAIAAGGNHSLALCSDGTVAAWGYNGFGELGNNSTTSSSVPVAVTTTMGTALAGKTVVAIAAGNNHSLALCSDGTVAAWGYNPYGELGNNSTTNSSVPVAVTTTGTALANKTVVAIAAGSNDSMALCSDGTIAAWGYNTSGQLGNNSTTNSDVPVAVTTTGTALANKTVVAIAAGSNDSVALCSDGTLADWGVNDIGELGNNSTTNSNVPVSVLSSGVLANKTVVAIAAGLYHSMALCSDGTVAAWGYNVSGQLGNNTTTNSSVPVIVTTMGTPLAGETVVAIAARNSHSLAFCPDGTVAAWGYNADGELGNNSTTNSSVAVAVNTSSLAAGESFMNIAAGSAAFHSLALVASPETVPVITSPTTASVAAGAPFSYQITASGSPTSYGASQLPNGLSVNASGLISGTVSSPGPYPIILTALNSFGTSSPVTLNLTVTTPIPVITSSTTASGTGGQPFSYTITASNSPTSYSASGYPSELSFNSASGVLSGTLSPSDQGNYSITLTATNAGGTSQPVTLSLTVNAEPVPVITSPTMASGNAGQSFSYTIIASNSPTSYSASGYPSELSFSSTSGVLSGTLSPSDQGNYSITLTATNAGGTSSPVTLSLTVIPEAPVITSPTTASGTAGQSFSYQITATHSPTFYGVVSGLPSGLSYSSATGLISGTLSSSDLGGYSVILVASNAGGSSNQFTLYLTVNPAIAAPVITSSTTATGTAGQSFSYQITATNSPTYYNVVSGLPLGLNYSSVTGLISGTLSPSDLGAYSIVLTASNAGGSSNPFTLYLTVNPPVPAPVITSSTTASGVGGQSFLYTITATNSPTSYSASGYPSELSFNSTSGVLSGTLSPSDQGNYSITLTAANSGGTSSPVTLSLTVMPEAPTITSPLTASGTVGTSFNYQITASNSPTSYGAGPLPGGLTFSSSSGTIGGTPTSPGTYTIELTATNGGGISTPAALMVTINSIPGSPVITSGTTANVIAGAFFNYQVGLASNNSPTTYSATGLPSGLSINPATGLITGTVSGIGTYPVVLTATNGVGASFPVTLSLTVSPPTFTFASAAGIGVATSAYTATGLTLNVSLGFVPTAGTNLTVINNTGLPFIQGVFNNVAQGQIVPLSYGGVTYDFIANYYGGTGNDLVLQWANVRPVAWGNNGNGQLGNSVAGQSNAPVSVLTSGALAGKTILAIATGYSHTLALCSDGTLAAWGDNSSGELGSNGTPGGDVPVPVATGGTALAGKTVVAISAGNLYSLALCSDGTVAAWGNNTSGQLGNGGNGNSPVPVAVATLGTALAGKTVVAISAGNSHSLALCSDGTVAAWGGNNAGELGNGTSANSNVAVAVTTANSALTGETVIAVSAGFNHSVALCADGTLAAWGDNSVGELGNGTMTGSPVPVAVTTAGTPLAGKTVTAVSAGFEDSLAVCSDGTVAAWGDNSSGELGNNSTTNSDLPVAVSTTGTPLAGETVAAVAPGSGHNLALCPDGTAVAWGSNVEGQLGTAGNAAGSNVPVAISTSSLAAGEKFESLATGSSASQSFGLIASPMVFTPVISSPSSVVGTVNSSLSYQIVASNSPTSFALSGTLPAGLTFTAGTGIISGTPTSPGTSTVTLSAGNAAGSTTASLILVINPASYTYLSSTGIAITANGYNATGQTFNLNLGYAPLPGDVLTVIDNTGSSPITGTFSNLPDGGEISASYGGTLYTLVANYEGGDGNDLTLSFKFSPTFTSPGSVGLTTGSFIASGLNLTVNLGFAPTAGTVLTVINNTGSSPIGGTFGNLAEGGTITASYGGTTYTFSGTYKGGDGNDLTLTYSPTIPPASLVVLHSFQDGSTPNDGAVPQEGLTLATDGNLYGTTTQGGTNGHGTVYRISPQGQFLILHNFGDGTVGNDGQVPTATLVQGVDGFLYGTTRQGGSAGEGTVFRMSLAGQVSILHSWGASSGDGASPDAGVIQASDGNFYGMTGQGGSAGKGTVYGITPGGIVTLLHSFGTVTNDGQSPVFGGLVQGGNGLLYGTTMLGGSAGQGVVFDLTLSGAMTILHSFGDGSVTGDGEGPQASLVQGSDGNFYGTTTAGGSTATASPLTGGGTAYKITPLGQVTILHSFGDGTLANDGTDPISSLLIGADGNFYGVTGAGGSAGQGTVFKATPQGVVSILHSFGDGSVPQDGSHGSANSAPGLVQESDGSLYGVTAGGGAAGGDGIIFKLTLNLPVVTSSLAASGTVGIPFSYQATATNTPTIYAATQLPPGLSINAATGLISGTPTMIGPFTTTLTLTNSQGSTSTPLSFTIAALPYPVISGILSAYGTVGSPFGYSITANNNTTSYNASSLPPGLSINSATGTIYGTPTTVGTYPVTIYATNATGTTPAALSIQITGVPPTLGQEYVVLHRFSSTLSAAGVQPLSIFQGFDGTLYGTTTLGGSDNGGVVFNSTLQGATSVVGASGGGGQGQSVIQGSDGNFYGVTLVGGSTGDGVIFKLTPAGVRTILHVFGDGSVANDGANPNAALIQGADGSFYGTTKSGGSANQGTIFQLDARQKLTIIHSFGDGTVANDGQVPGAGLFQDPTGTFYGTTTSGGVNGKGTVYTMTTDGTTSTVTTIHSFGDPNVTGDGVPGGISGAPTLIQGFDGNYYGTTAAGGAFGMGCVYQISSAGDVAIIHSFGDPSVANDGTSPAASLTVGFDGNFYGTTQTGGTKNGGTTFEVTSTGTEVIIHSFGDPAGSQDGITPLGALCQGADGNFYGTTAAGGSDGSGTIFAIVATQTTTHVPVFIGSSTIIAPLSTPVTYIPKVAYGVSGTGSTSGNNGNAVEAALKSLSSLVFVPQDGTSSTATTWTLSGTLPNECTFDSSDGLITGTPFQPGIYPLTITPSNSVGQGIPTTVTMYVDVAPILPSTANVSGYVNSTFTYNVAGQAQANPTRFGATGLPSWMSVNTQTGLISGMPPGTGNYVFNPTASNDAGTTTQQVTLAVTDPSQAAPVILSPTAAAGTVGLYFSYQIGASQAAVSYTATSLPTGLLFDSKAGVISGTPSAVGTFNVPISATTASGAVCSGNVTITISPITAPVITSSTSTSGTLNAPLQYQIQATNSPSSYSASGLPPGLSLSSTGLINGTPTATGTSTVTLSASNVGTGTAILLITVDAPFPVISSGTTASGTVNQPFSYQITASDSPVSYAATGLPNGLMVASTTGVISGTPTTAGQYFVTLTATDNAGGTGSSTLIINVAGPLAAPVISSANNASATTYLNFNYQIVASNSPTSYGATNLPAGLSVNPSTGLISGIPTTPGIYTKATISAANATRTTTTSLIINVSALQSPTITSASSTNGQTGQYLSFQVTASNFPTSFSASNLPPGLSIDPTDGIIYGTPTAPGVTNVNVTATNQAGTGNVATLTISIIQLPVITSNSTASGSFAGSFNYTVTALYGATSFGATGLPPGLTINSSTGVISGMPTNGGIYHAVISATNMYGPATSNLTLTISEPFSQWAAGNGTSGSATATPLHDGVPNLLKFLFDINPLTPMATTDVSAMPAVAVTTISQTQYLTLTYRQSSYASGVVVQVQTSSNVTSWSAPAAPDISQQVGTDATTGDPIMQVGVKMTSSNQYIRLYVTAQ